MVDERTVQEHVQLELVYLSDGDEFAEDEAYIRKLAAEAEQRRERKMPFGPNLGTRLAYGRDGEPMAENTTRRKA